MSLAEKGNIRLSWVEKRFSRLSKYDTDLHVIKKKNKSLTFPPNLKKLYGTFSKIHAMWLLCTIPVASVEDMIGWKVSRPVNQVNILTDREMIFPALGARYMYMARVVIH